MLRIDLKSRQKYLIFIITLFFLKMPGYAQFMMENLNRGLIAIKVSETENFLSWRWLGTEGAVSFNIYRNNIRINNNPIGDRTNYTDKGGTSTSSYIVRPVFNGVEGTASENVTPWEQPFYNVPILPPAAGTAKDGVDYSYNANDASIGDLDGDGEWEIILKWDPGNSKDNSQSGYTGNTFLDAYKLNGTRLWRIDLGINIRSGAHYMDFMVYDFDGDGKAEMMCRTSDGTYDGTGKVIGREGADYRNSTGYVLTGPEYVTVFDGQTGAAMASVNYVPTRGAVQSWGDGYGNRVDRFRAGVAYLDGKNPSAIFCRGYYTRSVIAAWDWRNGKLTSRWVFDSNISGNTSYAGQGDHSLSIADVDNDGRQEIIVGSAIIDDDGTGYYNTQYGHGDALHASDLDPDLDGIEVFNIQEPVAAQGAYMYNALSKTVLWTKPTAAGSGEGPGRGVCADISAEHRGAESWVAGGGISGVFDCKGKITDLPTPNSCNFLVWWDGDLLRELLNGNNIQKFQGVRLLTATGCTANNGTKSTPALSGDILGDWREEVIWRTEDNRNLRIYTSTIPSNYRFRTLLHDPQYRVALAWQNTGYNQPPHVSYYLGDGMMSTPVKPDISVTEKLTGTTRDESTVRIFCAPNPFEEDFQLICPGDFVFTIYDLTGNVMERGVATTSTKAGSALKAGVYIIKVTTQRDNRFVKIQKSE